MIYLMSVFLIGLVIGLAGVASNPSPYFAALGLVVAAGCGCGVLVGHGGPFLSLVLFLIYLGGMLVVFAYSAALAAEPYPENWGDLPVLVTVLFYALGLVVAAIWFWKEGFESFFVSVEVCSDRCVVQADTVGIAWMYSSGGGCLIVSAGVLLLTLFGVMELTRGLSRGTIRAV
uniref:NADH-ubiquinone oxidoreductase chain 6 n=1 Tax=Plesiops nakaharae TaxID=270570 RepID=A0A1V1FLU1_9TELE|nr:NADH dehydrogenase subunit 6 [Plesiops nakaharae]BAX03836.1 NADH dehydrogenase subunit 6 [Plesiops nakaharae]BBU25889.1 NADH dehydrogenase subunit 6 [Plesiops nakaharae]